MATTLTNWHYRQKGTSTWFASCSGSAVEIYLDLMASKAIDNPFVDDNEVKVQWVADQDWEYQTTFEVTDMSRKTYQLVAEGLDTFATVYVNEHKVACTENMFITYVIRLDAGILVRGTNTVRIEFALALLRGRQLESRHFTGKFSNGESLRLYVRKAQYQWGWDWGPRLISCGPYRPLRFESFDQAITDVYVQVNKATTDIAELMVLVELVGAEQWQLEICDADGNRVVNLTSSKAHESVSIYNPKLWWPSGTGTPWLYTTKVTIADTNITKQFDIGIRTMELIQQPLADEDGTTFYFKVNSKPIFIQGANWIPVHSLPTQVTDATIKQLVTMVREGGQNCLRVWGGGFYETDTFLNECDRQAILVWHDFPFACGQYPGYPEFIENVTTEVKSNLKRMRNHPCLLVFAGNNEDYQIAEQFGLEWDPYDHLGNYTSTTFPARQLYEVIFPQLMAEFLPTVPYHPGSPWSGEYPTLDPLRGDLHQWNVWHGTQEPYQTWHLLGGRFVSEFGMEAFPSVSTFRKYILDSDQFYPQLRIIEHHNKAFGFVSRLSRYVFENLRVNCVDMELWVYATQLMQAECIGKAYRHWRRRWRHRACGGALVWQLNDCWPATLWLIIDFQLKPKLAYYAIKRECQPITVGTLRKESGMCEVWGVNMTANTIKHATLVIKAFDVSNGTVVDTQRIKVTLSSNQTTEITHYKLPMTQPTVLHFQLFQGKTCITSTADWPQPLKYLHFSGTEVGIKVDDDKLELRTNKPTKGVMILAPNEIILSDNGFDLFPGEVKLIKAKNMARGDKVDVTWYTP